MTDPRLAGDPFLRKYEESELRIASEFLRNWIPFLTRDLCRKCTLSLSHRISSLSPPPQANGGQKTSSSGGRLPTLTSENDDTYVDDCDTHSLGSWNDEEELNSSICCKDEANGWSKSPVMTDASSSNSGRGIFDTPRVRMSWADMAQEDEFKEEIDIEESKQEPNGQLSNGESSEVVGRKTELPREQREYLRFMNVRRKKDFVCLQRVNGKITNIVQGLELHTGIFSAVEQKRIVDHVYELAEKGKKGELKERTFTAPRKWMKGKGRVTIQFGCCYNYAVDKKGNPPGILQKEEVDPLPSLFKVIIKRLIRWHVLPPSCVPDSCIVNIYDEGDCIPPHIDNYDFVRPFCTISFLSECNILFGTDLKIEGPGEFSGDMAIPLPVGSVLVLNGNGADVAKHCVPAVPSKRISITFRKMDESKRPVFYAPEPDLQGLEPLCYDEEESKKSGESKKSLSAPPHKGRQGLRGGSKRPVFNAPERNLQTLEPLCYDEEEYKKSEEPKNSSSALPHKRRQGRRSVYNSERNRPEEPRYFARNRSPHGGSSN